MRNKHIILASNSPRRKELLSKLDIDFEVKVIPGISENYPSTLPALDVSEYIARLKAKPYEIKTDEVLITADTTVVVGNTILGKPANEQEARQMLQMISGITHKVVTGVCITTQSEQRSFKAITDVTFKPLSNEEISYYITHYKPFDKAGAYGIQEWIGMVGVTSINGSFFNVMGLPVQRIYEELRAMNLLLHD